MPTNPADRLAAIEARAEKDGYSEIYEPHAREDVLWLLAELRTLQQQRDALIELARTCFTDGNIAKTIGLAALSAEREPEKPATLPSKD